EDEVIEPAGRDHAEERLVHRAPRTSDGGLEGVDLLRERLAALELDRAGDDRALALGRHRLFPRPVEDRAGGRGVLGEPAERAAPAGDHPRRGGLVRLERPCLYAREVTAQVTEVAHLPEFAVADAVDAELELLADHVIDTGIDHRRLDLVAAEQP